MPEIRSESLLGFVERMPAFPNSVQRVLQLTADINVPCKDIIQVIETDPVMTLRILKVVNSPYYGLPQKISSIQRAVVHIGINTIKNMALSIAVMGALSSFNKAGFDTNQFLLHSLCTAFICKLLAERLQILPMDSGDYYAAGLLHDLGKVIFAEFAGEDYKKVLDASLAENVALQDAEMNILGTDHSIAGKLLAEHWNFGSDLVDSINHHHTLCFGGQLTECLFAANQISKWLQFGFSGNPVIEEFPQTVAARFGADLSNLIDSLGNPVRIKSEVLSFFQL